MEKNTFNIEIFRKAIKVSLDCQSLFEIYKVIFKYFYADLRNFNR